ncbi:MAG: YHS domain-containing protein [Nitrospirae bacterium]|nr:MAG: YHS domain-containing protein [Nitrospirota bacterium]
MYRLIIILILLIILFLMVRKAIREFFSRKTSDTALPGKDVMIQDPVCKLYIPVDSAITEKIGGQIYYFCSDDCAYKFKHYMSG